LENSFISCGKRNISLENVCLTNVLWEVQRFPTRNTLNLAINWDVSYFSHSGHQSLSIYLSIYVSVYVSLYLLSTYIIYNYHNYWGLDIKFWIKTVNETATTSVLRVIMSSYFLSVCNSESISTYAVLFIRAIHEFYHDSFQTDSHTYVLVLTFSLFSI
jgi:hypothetical protein